MSNNINTPTNAPINCSDETYDVELTDTDVTALLRALMIREDAANNDIVTTLCETVEEEYETNTNGVVVWLP